MVSEARREFLREIGSRGGKATVAKHGRDHMARIGAKGFATAIETVGGKWLWDHRLGDGYVRKYHRQPKSMISKEEAQRRAKVRAEARKTYRNLTCVVCGDQNAERHHVNGLAAGNGVGNIAGYCKPHHQEREREILRERRAAHRARKATA